MSKLLELNMAALRMEHPGLVSAVPDASGDYELVPSSGGAAACRGPNDSWVHGPRDPWAEAVATAAQVVDSDDRLYVLVRPGLGYLQLALLDALGDRAGASRFLWLEDRLPLVRLALETMDWTPILMNRSVTLCFGPILATLERFLLDHPAAGLLPTSIVVDGQAVRDQPDLPRMVGAMLTGAGAYATDYSSGALAGAKNTREWRVSCAPRVVVAFEKLDYLADSVAAGFDDAGCDVMRRTVGTARTQFTKDADWALWLPTTAADVLFWTNRPHVTKRGAPALREMGIQNVLWSLDDPRALGLRRSDYEACDLYLSYDSSHLRYAAEMGASRVAQLSTAVGLAPAHDGDSPPRKGPAVGFVGGFVDDRMGLLREAYRAGDPGYLSFLEALATSDEDIEGAFAEAGRPCAGAGLFFVSHERTVRRRRAFLRPLAGLGLRTYGAAAWGDPAITAELAPCYAGFGVPYGPSLARVYYDTLVNVNVFHAQCRDSTNSRIYDVLAAGGFLLSEDSPRLHAELDVGKHLVTFRTPEEAADKAAYYLRHADERDEIARAGQRHVLENHTYVHRAREVMALLGRPLAAGGRAVAPPRAEMPVFINNRDRLTSTRRMVQDIRRMGGRPIIVDNDSTYPPLLAWYATNPCEILRLGANVGAYSAWRCGLAARVSGHYVVTDSDLDLTRCPDDTLEVLSGGLAKFAWATKAGLSLRIDDVPMHFAAVVGESEGAFWRSPVDEMFYRAEIDTTFAVYHSTRPVTPHTREFCSAVRSGAPYCARHLPWYADSGALDAEERYYLEHCRRGEGYSSWAARLAG